MTTQVNEKLKDLLTCPIKSDLNAAESLVDMLIYYVQHPERCAEPSYNDLLVLHMLTNYVRARTRGVKDVSLAVDIALEQVVELFSDKLSAKLKDNEASADKED